VRSVSPERPRPFALWTSSGQRLPVTPLSDAGLTTKTVLMACGDGREADARHPYDPEILSALISMNREAGDVKAALDYAHKAAEALPDDPAVQRLVADLQGKSDGQRRQP